MANTWLLTERQKEIEKYLSAAANLYGHIMPRAFLVLFNRYNKQKLLKSELMKYWNKLMRQDNRNYILYENAIISNRVKPDRIDQIIHYQGTKKFYIPSEQELLKYASDSYYEETEYTSELRVFLRQKLQADIISSESFVSGLSWMIRTEEPMQEQNNLIEKHNIGLDMKNAHILFSHMQNLNNNSRKWANCGFTPMEIRMQLENK